MSKYLFSEEDAITDRDLSNLEADQAAVRALVQAAVNVELFTIPLYMTALYSIQGMHQITSKGNNFYQGRLWPGMSTTPISKSPLTPNEDAFNKVFGVFIAEMLHLQLASNLATAVGCTPTFTSPALQSEDHGWICYGEGLTTIPHILNLKDTLPGSPYHNVEVKLQALNAEQVQLFLAIEESGTTAQENVAPDVWEKYYNPKVPFAGWDARKTEMDLPMFGTIGHMYLCLWEYISIRYTDGSSLWSHLFDPNSIQQDLFNNVSGRKQYPEMPTKITGPDSETALMQALNIVDAITDQGEGKEVAGEIGRRLHLAMARAVEQKYQPSTENIAELYPDYSDTGEQEEISSDASARGYKNAGMDHFEIFQAVQEIVHHPEFSTWDMWHNAGNRWDPRMLITNEQDYEENLNNYPQLPRAEEIADALNNLKENDHNGNYELLSKASTGSIAGMTTVMNNFWNKETPNTKFPMPAMGGTGDRLSTCWAIFGMAPNLRLGIPPKDNVHNLYHACQGLSLDPSDQSDPNRCAAVEVYHTCIGSNDCRSQGGCGYVQSTSGSGSCSGGGGNCGSSVKSTQSQVLCGSPSSCGTPVQNTYSAPADNKCGAFGGCAVPISASQMFPDPKGPMEIFNFTNEDGKWHAHDTGEQYPYEKGQLVYDVAWDVYTRVLESQGRPVPEKPRPHDIRIAFPPST